MDTDLNGGAERRLPPARVRVRVRPTPSTPPKPGTVASSQGPGAPAPTPHAQPADYEVGYGKPPKQHQFQRGQSGNPRGRPKKSKNLNTVVRDAMLEQMVVRTARGQKRVTRLEALIMKLIENAAKGNPRALDQLLKLYVQAVPPEETGQHGEEAATSEVSSAADEQALLLLRALMLEEAGINAPSCEERSNERH